MWRQLVEREVGAAGIRVVDLNLDAGTVTYSRRIRQHRPISSIADDKEIVRADLVNRFVNEMGYDPEYIELDRPVVVTDPDGKTRTETVDVVVNHRDGSPFFFAAVKSPDTFHEDDGTGARLIRLAEAEREATGKTVQHLFYYTVDVKAGQVSGESVIINFEHFLKGSGVLDAKGKALNRQPSFLQRRLRQAQRDCRRVVRYRYKDSSYLLFLR